MRTSIIPIIAGLLSLLINYSFLSCNMNTNHIIHRLDGTVISHDSISAEIKHITDAAGVHGLAFAIFNDNRAVFKQTYGYKNYGNQLMLNDTTNIYGASLSKAVFSILVMKFVEEGVIDLDTPLASYLPKKVYEYEPQTSWHDDYSDLETDTLYHKITARMCLSHTAGFPNWRWFEPDQKLRVKFKPGERYFYSGEGFVYLQVVIEKITNKGLEELAQEKLFQPLGMNRTSYEWKESFENDFAYGHNQDGELYQKDKDNEPRSGSTLETTLEDYTIFLEAVLQNKILTQESWQEILTPQIRLRSVKQFGPLSQKDTTLYDKINLSYGLGWGLLETPYGWGAFKEGHGDGFQHYSIIFPETGKGILIMANSDNGESSFKEILEVTFRDTYTPWEWQGYYPYDYEE